MEHFKIGIDLGGTKIEGVIINDDNEILQRKRIPTLQEKGYLSIVDRIFGLIEELKGTATSISIGIGTPGTVSPKTGLIRNSNTQCLIGKPLKQDLEARIGHEISIANDANCFAMAEAKMGAAIGSHLVFGVIMGTGVGGGIVIDHKVHNGKNFIAGEWGHSILHPGGNKCYCGRRGCVETYLSGTWLEKRWHELTGETAKLADIIVMHEQAPTDIYLKWKAEFLENYGIALSNIINVLDPDVIVMGGGVSNIPFLYTEGLEQVIKNVFSDVVETRIVQNKLGDSAGVIGAAFLN